MVYKFTYTVQTEHAKPVVFKFTSSPLANIGKADKELEEFMDENYGKQVDYRAYLLNVESR